jgi:hypothetical protein
MFHFHIFFVIMEKLMYLEMQVFFRQELWSEICPISFPKQFFQ